MAQSLSDPPDTETETAEAWRRARADYERGVSAPVTAERYGLHVRTLRRHAAREGWRRPPPPSTFHARMAGERPPPFAGEPVTLEQLTETDPELAMFSDAHEFEVGELLLNPDPQRLGRFAFRRAAEAAARGAVAEAGGWMRLVTQVGRASDRLSRELRPVSSADLMRARYAAELRAVFEAAEDEADEAAAPGPEA